jgi:hypothetical protein
MTVEVENHRLEQDAMTVTNMGSHNMTVVYTFTRSGPRFTAADYEAIGAPLRR